MKTIITLSLAASLSAGLMTAIPAANAATVATSHTAWCQANYRSYNPATDTFNGYDGLVHRCMSPYDGANVTFGAVAPLVVLPNSGSTAIQSAPANTQPAAPPKYELCPNGSANYPTC